MPEIMLANYLVVTKCSIRWVIRITPPPTWVLIPAKSPRDVAFWTVCPKPQSKENLENRNSNSKVLDITFKLQQQRIWRNTRKLVGHLL